MDILMLKGSTGPDVERLRAALAAALGDEAKAFAALAAPGGAIDEGFDAAIKRWQAGVGLIADGVVGPRCQMALGLLEDTDRMALPLTVAKVSRLFPATKPANIARYLPYVGAALGVAGLTDPAMLIGALGTIRAETEGFVPISEFQSRFNTDPGQPPFNRYDLRLGNTGPGEGARFRGRGFVQLTGRDNYTRYGAKVGLALQQQPDAANAPEIAAVLLALFLRDKAPAFRAAIVRGDHAAARKLVNGGSHGLERFTDVFERARTTWPDELAVAAAREAAPGRAGAATRRAGRLAQQSLAARERRPGSGTESRTRKDAADLRDRPFTPAALTLPDACPGMAQFHYLPRYIEAGLVMAQGEESSCTGFGLACVVNYLRWIKSHAPQRMASVSPRMLYTLARRHDEFDGENYEGSTCRGAIKGWFNHGVCLEADWPYTAGRATTPRYGFAGRAAEVTLGVYYRIDARSITDMQAAIAQHGAIFVSAFTHDGWQRCPEQPAPATHAEVPLIPFDGRRSETGGHAFAMVGYDARGFIVQNSWGTGFGAGGFAVIAYRDWLANAMDAWVVSLGVPQVIAGRLALEGIGTAGAGAALGAGDNAERERWWDSAEAYRHSVVLGNDGRVSRYLTEDEQPRKLQQQCAVLPDAWFRARPGPARQPRRVVLVVHGGLNDEAAAIRRASAMGRYFTANGCYPLFLVWKTGLLETLGDIVSDAFAQQPRVAGAPEWATDISDRVIEKAARPLAKPVWSEMKENAAGAFLERRGGDLLLEALSSLAGTWGADFELHLVGHSAGSIAIGHLLNALASRALAGKDQRLFSRLGTLSLFAPACTVAFANDSYARHDSAMRALHLDILSDRAEREDNVGRIYRKSLLYLVSNALEPDIHTPILGLARVMDPGDTGWDGSSDTGDALKAWREAAKAHGLDAPERTAVLDAAQVGTAIDAAGQPVRIDAAHGSFDNDLEIVSRTLRRVLGLDAQAALPVPVTDLRGF